MKCINVRLTYLHIFKNVKQKKYNHKFVKLSEMLGQNSTPTYLKENDKSL